jgi:hypothetical protein
MSLIVLVAAPCISAVASIWPQSAFCHLPDRLAKPSFSAAFAASEDASVAVCVLPGTELSFAEEITCITTGMLSWGARTISHKTAIFRQITL